MKKISIVFFMVMPILSFIIGLMAAIFGIDMGNYSFLHKIWVCFYIGLAGVFLYMGFVAIIAVVFGFIAWDK